MSSEQRIRANRENAKRGGVKSAAGKAISKANSLKHGILAQGSAPGDSLSLEDVYSQLHQEFSPETPTREFLVQQLAITVVRLARCCRLEADIFREQATWFYDVAVTLDRLATLAERYESRLVGRMLRLIEALKAK